MAIDNDVMRIKAKGSLFGQEILNVFFYVFSSTSGGNLAIDTWADDWAESFGDEIVTFLADDVNYFEIEIDNLTDGNEFHIESVDIDGTDSSPAMPSNVAYSFILNRTTKLTRNGGKRFAGCTDVNVTDNQVSLSGAIITGMQDWLGEPLTLLDVNGSGVNVTLDPVIVGRTKDGSGVYQLDLAKLNFVANARIRQTVGSQNTRKP